jgi:hypothetical protein
VAGPRRPNAAGAEKLPSLTSPSGSVNHGLDPRLGLGLALLGLGIVLPLGGFLVAEMRRRRAQPRRALRR